MACDLMLPIRRTGQTTTEEMRYSRNWAAILQDYHGGSDIYLWHSAKVGILEKIRFCVDSVAKVENRTALKISRKLIFRPLYRCRVLQRRYEGPWSISGDGPSRLCARNASAVLKLFRSSAKNDSFNTICRQRPFSNDELSCRSDARIQLLI
jgi:hypothetical protein